MVSRAWTERGVLAATARSGLSRRSAAASLMGRKKQSAPPAGARIPNIVIFIGSALATVVTAALIAHFTKSPPTAREQHQQPHSQPPSPRSVYPTKSTTDSNTRDAAVEKARALIGSMTGWGHTASRALDAACAELATLLSPHVSEMRIGITGLQNKRFWDAQ